MPFMVNVQNGVQIDIMILQKYWPKMVGLIAQTGCVYSQDDHVRLPNKHKYIILRDVKAKNGSQLGELIKLFYAMEWDALTSDQGDAADTKVADKFYILVRPRKKGNGHAQKNRTKTGTGREGRNEGEPGNSGSEPVAETTGDGSELDISGANDLREPEE